MTDILFRIGAALLLLAGTVCLAIPDSAISNTGW